MHSDERQSRVSIAVIIMDWTSQCFKRSGAQYVVDSIADVVACLEDIQILLARGEKP